MLNKNIIRSSKSNTSTKEILPLTSESNLFSYHQNLIHPVDYAIISAMPEELDYIKQEFSNLDSSEINIGEFKFIIYNYKNTKILIAHTGMGTSFAAFAITLIYSHFNPEYILVCGTSGGIKKDLKLRDVIIAEKAFEAEIQDVFSLLKGTAFENCLKHPITNKFFPAHYSADPELLSICDSLNLSNQNHYKGTVVSSNAFPAPKELFEKIKSFDPYSIDMETSAFYQIAWLLNIKILAIRGISNILTTDGSDEKIHEADVQGSSLSAAAALLSILNQAILLNCHKKSKSNASNNEALQLISKLNLQPHPEGGYFTVSYKANHTVKPSDSTRYNDEVRSTSTSIYYLLNRNDYSAWHILKSDEIWHFYKGSPLYIYVINDKGLLSRHILGDPLKTKGATFQVCIERDHYFAAENVDKNSYSLVGCTVAPGFEYTDFELCETNSLLSKFPQHTDIIYRMCKHS